MSCIEVNTLGKKMYASRKDRTCKTNASTRLEDCFMTALLYAVDNMLGGKGFSVRSVSTRSPRRSAGTWVVIDVQGSVNASFALACCCPREMSACLGHKDVAIPSRAVCCELLNVAVSHMATDLYNQGITVELSAPRMLRAPIRSLGARARWVLRGSHCIHAAMLSGKGKPHDRGALTFLPTLW